METNETLRCVGHLSNCVGNAARTQQTMLETIVNRVNEPEGLPIHQNSSEVGFGPPPVGFASPVCSQRAPHTIVFYLFISLDHSPKHQREIRKDVGCEKYMHVEWL